MLLCKQKKTKTNSKAKTYKNDHRAELFWKNSLSRLRELHGILVSYSFCKKWPQKQWLKTTRIYHVSFHGSGVWAQPSGVLYSGSQQAAVGCWPGLWSPLGAVERIHFLMVVLAATGAEGRSSLLLAGYWLEATLESRGHQQLTQWVFAFSRFSGESRSL